MTAAHMRIVALIALAVLIGLSVARWLDYCLGAVEFGGLR